MARNFKLNLAGGGEVLKELAAPLVADYAQRIASLAGGEAEVSTSDRARAVVKVPADKQAADGALSKAAASVGLEVRPSKGGSSGKRRR